MPIDIFISYASPDLDFVNSLRDQLIERGYTVWLDPDNDQLDLAHTAAVKAHLQTCQVFLLVESPAAVESVKVRGETSSAFDNFAKPVILLKWQPAPNPPRAMQTLLNRLSQRLDLAGGLSPDNLERLELLLQRHLPPPAQAVATPAPTGRKLGTLSANQPATSSTGSTTLALGVNVISNLVTPLELEPDDTNLLTGELQWLFSALDTLLKIANGQADRSQPVAVPIPAGAQIASEATNHLLDRPALHDPTDFEDFVGEVKSQLTRLTSFLRELAHFTEQERQDGEAGKRNESLQANLKDARLKIAKLLQVLARQGEAAYGIFVTSPDELVEILAGRINPISLGAMIIKGVITPLGLNEDDQEFIATELKWLFAATKHYQQIVKIVQQKLAAADETLKAGGMPSARRETELSQRLPEIRRTVLDQSQSVALDIPPDAERMTGATNRLLALLDDDDLGYYFKLPLGTGLEPEGSVNPLLNQLNIRLEALQTLNQSQAALGEEGKRNIQLQNDLRSETQAIVATLQRLARSMQTAYDIYVTIPDQLAEQLEA